MTTRFKPAATTALAPEGPMPDNASNCVCKRWFLSLGCAVMVALTRTPVEAHEAATELLQFDEQVEALEAAKQKLLVGVNAWARLCACC